MPKIEFETGFKKKSNTDFNKLTLDQNERARVCVIESPTVEYVHPLSRVIMDQGKPVMTTKTYGKNNEKSREVPETDYVGRYLCLGDFDVLESKGVDPDNCPACKASIESSAVDGPTRRFAAHVIQYQVKKGGFAIQEPFQISLKVWDFTNTRYDALTDIKEEHGSLPGLDLNLGPCENKGFQKYTISPGNGCEWSKSADRKKIVREVLESQKVDDLSLVLGRRVNFAELNGQVQDVVRTWNQAFGVPGSMPAEEKKVVEDNTSLDLNFDTDSSEETASEEKPVEKKSSNNIESLEDLLGDL